MTGSIYVERFNGVLYVDYTRNRKKVPCGKDLESDHVDKRLRALGINPSFCRTTRYKNISKSAAVNQRGFKSVWVPVDLWKNALPELDVLLVMPPVEDSEDNSVVDTVDIADTDDLPLIHEIQLEDHERLMHEAKCLPLILAGDRHPDRCFVITSTVHQALELSRPCVVAKKYASDRNVVYLDGSVNTVSVIPFRHFVQILSVHCEDSPVATCIFDWICELVFIVQYGNRALVGRQCEHDIARNDADGRDLKYSARLYGLEEEPGLYVVSVCSGAQFAEEFPEQAEATLPNGADMEDFELLKGGWALKLSRRVCQVRGDLKKIFKSKVDPRPVGKAVSRTTPNEKELFGLETRLFDMYESERVHGIVVLEKSKEEWFLVRKDERRAFCETAVKIVGDFDRMRIQETHQTLVTTETQKLLAVSGTDKVTVENEQLKQRLAETKERLAETSSHLEQMRQEAVAARKEASVLKDRMTRIALSMSMGKKSDIMAAIKSVFQ